MKLKNYKDFPSAKLEDDIEVSAFPLSVLENRLAVIEKRLKMLEQKNIEEPMKKKEDREEINRLSKPAIISELPEPSHKVGDMFRWSYKEYCKESTNRFVITNVICLENGNTFRIEYIYEAIMIPPTPDRPPYYFSEAVVYKGKERIKC